MSSGEKLAMIEAEQKAMRSGFDTMVKSMDKVVSELSGLTLALNESVIEQKHANETVSRLYQRIDKLEEKTSTIERTQIGFKPWVDLMKSINNRIWFIMLGVLFTAVGSVGAIGFAVSQLGAP